MQGILEKWKEIKDVAARNRFAFKFVNSHDLIILSFFQDVLLGGPRPQDKDSDDIKEIAHFAVEDMNKKSNALFKQTLVEVISAHTQVKTSKIT